MDPNHGDLDPSVNPLPVTGLGTNYRLYWRHSAGESAVWPIARAFAKIEPESTPAGGSQGASETQSSSTQWRWRFHWVVAPFGAHVGIDYYPASGTLQYLDYGQPPDQGGCSCCNNWANVYWWGVNNRYYRAWNSLPANYTTGWYSDSSGNICGCFNNDSGDGAPRNWTDSSGTCCRYYWNGWTPSGWSGTWSNSNGGIHAAFHRCFQQAGIAATSYYHPPVNWTHYTPGISNNWALVPRNDSCPGDRTDRD